MLWRRERPPERQLAEVRASLRWTQVRTYQRYAVVAREGGHGTGLSVVVHGGVLRWLSPARGMLVVGGPPPPRELGPGSVFCEEVLDDAPTLTLTLPLCLALAPALAPAPTPAQPPAQPPTPAQPSPQPQPRPHP